MSAPTTDAPSTSAGLVPVSALFADFDSEFASTRRLLARFPAAHVDWKPHAKSMTLGRLASHVAELPGLALLIATRPEWNAAVDGRFPSLVARTAEELVAAFDEGAGRLREALPALDAPRLAEQWRMRNGDVVYFQGTRGDLLRRFLVSHTAHHRGQLSVYYRLLDVPVPGMYGPSADER